MAVEDWATNAEASNRNAMRARIVDCCEVGASRYHIGDPHRFCTDLDVQTLSSQPITPNSHPSSKPKPRSQSQL